MSIFDMDTVAKRRPEKPRIDASAWTTNKRIPEAVRTDIMRRAGEALDSIRRTSAAQTAAKHEQIDVRAGRIARPADRPRPVATSVIGSDTGFKRRAIRQVVTTMVKKRDVLVTGAEAQAVLDILARALETDQALDALFPPDALKPARSLMKVRGGTGTRLDDAPSKRDGRR